MVFSGGDQQTSLHHLCWDKAQRTALPETVAAVVVPSIPNLTQKPNVLKSRSAWLFEVGGSKSPSTTCTSAGTEHSEQPYPRQQQQQWSCNQYPILHKNQMIWRAGVLGFFRRGPNELPPPPLLGQSTANSPTRDSNNSGRAINTQSDTKIK